MEGQQEKGNLYECFRIETLVLDGHPLWPVLGRAGRAAIMDQLLAEPDRIWHLRELARVLNSPPTSVARGVQDWTKLGIVERLRDGQQDRIQLLAGHPLLAILQALPSPEEAWRAQVQVLATQSGAEILNVRLIEGTLELDVADDEDKLEAAERLMDLLADHGAPSVALLPV